MGILLKAFSRIVSITLFWTVLFVYLGPTYFRLFFHVLFLLVGCSKGGWLANQSISLDLSLLIQTYGICRYLQWQLTKYWKVAHWNAKKLLKISKNKKICYLNFKSCYQNFCIFFVNVNLKVYFLFVTIITNIGPEKLLEVSFKEMLEITGWILRVVTNYSYSNNCLLNLSVLIKNL